MRGSNLNVVIKGDLYGLGLRTSVRINHNSGCGWEGQHSAQVRSN